MKKFLLLLLLPLITVAQVKIEPATTCHEVTDKKIIKLYEKGLSKKDYKRPERFEFLKQALEADPDFVEANFAMFKELLIMLRADNKPFKQMEPYLYKIIEVCPKYHSDPYYFLAFSLYEQEKYDSAAVYLNKFLKFKEDNDKAYSNEYEGQLYQSKQMLNYIDFYNTVLKTKVPFDPVPVENICTQQSEYLPYISPDNELMYFTRRTPEANKDRVWASDREIERFTLAKNINGKFESGKPLPPPFNKNPNEGGATISLDNKHIFYTICKDEGGEQLNCDIYYSDFINGQWTEVKKVEGINDPKYFDSQPTLAADGKTLLFASDRKGGYGGIDLYQTVKDETGKWSAPQNLGPVINTGGHEKSPFMHSDSETLYFASDGHPSVGGFDIFLTKKDEKGAWTKPRNIGVPINSEDDDLGLFVSTDGATAYFSTNKSSRVKGRIVGGWDIFSFELYKEARPEKVAFIKGDVKNEAGATLKGKLEVELTSSKTKQKTKAVVDTVSGKYIAIVNLKKKEDFLVDVKKEGIAFSSQLVQVKDLDTTGKLKPTKVNIETKEIKANETYKLNNLYYATNSAKLKDESLVVLEKFVEFLKANPKIKIEIHGHTDNVGNDKDNLALSTDRAFTVYDLLLKMGADKEQFIGSKYKGFGSGKPIASNDSEDGRSKNRRTEFLIVEK